MISIQLFYVPSQSDNVSFDSPNIFLVVHEVVKAKHDHAYRPEDYTIRGRARSKYFSLTNRPKRGEGAETTEINE